MERRPYFVFGDVLACTVIGVAAGWAAWLVAPAGWPAPLGMIGGMAVGMLAGMVVGLIGNLPFSPLFGAMEISLPMGLSGKMAGSVAGMLEGMAGISAATALWAGAATGLGCLAFTYVLQARLAGEVE